VALNIFTHKYGVVYTSDEGQLVSITNTYTGNEEVGIKTTITAGTSNKQLNVAAIKNNIQSMVLYATLSMTAITFLSTTQKDTFNLLAKNMVVWNDTLTSTIPLTSDFDSVKVSNANSTDGTFQMRVLMNQ
jgi:hypothetical protein